MKESVNAIARAISTVANEMVNVEDGYQTEMVQVVRQLTDVLEHVTRIPESVKTVTVTPIEEVKETVNVEVPVLEAVEEPSESASSADEVPESQKAVFEPELKKVKLGALKLWLNKHIEQAVITGKPELRNDEDEIVDTLLTNEARQEVFGSAKTVEVHFPVHNLLGKKEYITERVVELPVEDLVNRKWTRERISNRHKVWVQNYETEDPQMPRPFQIHLHMKKESNGDICMYLTVSGTGETKLLTRKADGKLVIGNIIDGRLDLEYDGTKYEQSKLRKTDEAVEKFATACGVQTVWDARNLK